MRADFETKLLDLTRQGRRFTLAQLAEILHFDTATVEKEIRRLRDSGFLSGSEDVVELSAAQRMKLAEHLIGTGKDLQKVSRYLDWKEFEDFARSSLEENGFRVLKHFVFKTRAGRREIDLVAWNGNFLFAIDCKHWSRGLSPSRAREVAKAQVERAVALAARPDLLRKKAVDKVERRAIVPVILSLCEPCERNVDGVPVVAVSKFMSFLYGISPVDERFRRIAIRADSEQTLLGLPETEGLI